jgi:tetratricopeptide (TPR) repeat protein
MGDRAVDCARLESVCTARYQGFESPPIRQRSFAQSLSVRLLLVLGLLLVLAIDSRAVQNDLAVAEREYSQEKFDAALASLDRFEKSGGPTAESGDLRGCIYLEQQKFDDAKKTFDAVHETNPDLFAPRIHAGDVLLRQKKFAEARTIYQALLKETNILMSHERLRFGVLLTYLGENDDTNARTAFQAIRFPTETPAYYYAQAVWAFAHDKKSEAQDWINKSKKVFEPDAATWFARHLYHLGWLQEKPALSKNHG